MAICYETGVQRPLNNMHLLRVKYAKRMASRLQGKLYQLERLIERLSPRDAIEFIDERGEKRTRYDSRLVCQTIMTLICEEFDEAELFERFEDVLARKRKRREQSEADKKAHRAKCEAIVERGNSDEEAATPSETGSDPESIDEGAETSSEGFASFNWEEER